MSDESTMTAPVDVQAEGAMGVAKGAIPAPDVPPGEVEDPIVIPAETFREQVPEVRTNNFVNRMV
jgi:hypothetical protein